MISFFFKIKYTTEKKGGTMHRYILGALMVAAPLFLTAEITPDEALKRLKEGNERFVSEKLLHPNRGQERMAELTSTQTPFAVVLTCSDSRVAPEIIFDQGIGDIFVVRVAGNVVGSIELESIWFATAVLKASTVLVLGHENCGAVRAAMEGNTKDIPAIAAKISPAVKGINLQEKNGLEKGTKDNVVAVASFLKNSPQLSSFIQNNKLSINTGYFQLKDGKVEFNFSK
jgi:carbonic anhydrase